MCMHFGLTNRFKLSISASSTVILEPNLILQRILQKLSKIFYVNIDVSKITATTDHGATVVAAFRIGILNNSARLDCMAHRLHICFTSMWSRACILEQDLLDYDNNALTLAKYCNQARNYKNNCLYLSKRDPQPEDGQVLLIEIIQLM